VSQFVSQNRNNLIDTAFLDQGIVNDNVLAPGQSIEIGVTVRTPLRAVDDVEVLQREVELGGQRFDFGLQLAVLQGRKLVEKRKNRNRIDSDHESLHSQNEQPDVVEEVVAKVANDLQESCENRATENSDQNLGFDGVHDELPSCEPTVHEYQIDTTHQFLRLLVEPKLLLQYKVLVVRERKADEIAGHGEDDKEDNRLRNLAAEPSRCIFRDNRAGNIPELGKNIEMDDCDIGDLTVERADETEFGLCATICLSLASITAPVSTYRYRRAYLRLVIDLLTDHSFKSFRHFGLTELLVLSGGEPCLEKILRDTKADNDRLPWDAWAIQVSR
jgi:hypothetical protein